MWGKLMPSPTSQPQVASVSVVRAVTIPSEKGCFVSAKVHGEQQAGDLLFEPDQELLHTMAIDMQESLLTVSDECSVDIPVGNFQGIPVQLVAGIGLGVVKSVQLERAEGVGNSLPVFNCTCGAASFTAVASELFSEI